MEEGATNCGRDNLDAKEKKHERKDCAVSVVNSVYSGNMNGCEWHELNRVIPLNKGPYRRWQLGGPLYR